MQELESRIGMLERRLEKLEGPESDNTAMCRKLDRVMEETQSNGSGLKSLQGDLHNLMRVLVAGAEDEDVAASM